MAPIPYTKEELELQAKFDLIKRKVLTNLNSYPYRTVLLCLILSVIQADMSSDRTL